jgi:hypothetical protein
MSKTRALSRFIFLFGSLEIGAWCLFDIWCLEFGILAFSRNIFPRRPFQASHFTFAFLLLTFALNNLLALAV